MDIGKWKLLAVSMTLLFSLAMPVLAYTYLYRTPAYKFSTGIVLQAPTMQLGFYWDSGCTQRVTFIDFGQMAQSSTSTYLTKVIYIRNEGSSSDTIFWNSTLKTVTTVIAETWEAFVGSPPYPPLNSTSLSSSSVLETTYHINIQAAPPVGTYNWTLTVWGETYV